VLSERTSLGFALRTGDGGAPIITDNGNLIADSDDGDIDDPAALAAIISAIPGCAGHGLFLGMTDLVLIGHDDGSVEELTARS
jgi:ribose 5-phosphate isomerase A